jgi:hypothetical protein
MPNVYIEARPKGRPALWAFVWLLAAGIAGPICAFAATWDWQWMFVRAISQ